MKYTYGGYRVTKAVSIIIIENNNNKNNNTYVVCDCVPACV